MFLKMLFPKLFNERGEVATVTAGSIDKSGGKQTGGQTQQAEKLTGLLADIDLSDVPVEQRDSVKKYVEQKVKQYDTGYRSKTEDVARERKELEQKKVALRELELLRDEIEGNPVLKSKVTKVINDVRAGRVTDDSAGKKILDNLIANASDADTRESLKQMREIIKDEAHSDDSTKQEIKALKEELAQLRSMTSTSHAEKVDIELSKLSERFGDDLVGKYKDEVRALALKYPSQKVEKLFKITVDDDDLRSAYVKEEQTKKQREQRIKENGSSVELSTVQTPIELKKDKFGRTDIRDLVGKIAAKIRK